MEISKQGRILLKFGRNYVTMLLYSDIATRWDDMLLLALIAALDTVNGNFFDKLVQTHRNRVYAIAYKMLGSKEDAEDMVQETFLKVYRSIEKFYDLEREEIIPLLVIYTKNTVRDHLRKHKHKGKSIPLVYEKDGEEKEYEIPDEALSPEETVINRESCKRMGTCIDALPEAQRHVVLLKYKYVLRDREIAKLLGISETAVSSRLNRAKESLRKMMGGESDA